MIIELDGYHHFTEKGVERDGLRIRALETYGLKVIRFSNHQIDTNFQEVCRIIVKVAEAALQEQGIQI